jgi:hypothetical protein
MMRVEQRMMTKRENMAVEEWEEAGRFMGSRRLAAVGRKIRDGADAQGGNKLMGSRRLAEANDLVLNAPHDKKRLLESRRLSKVRCSTNAHSNGSDLFLSLLVTTTAVA